jgi:hypothetical protein
VKTCTQCRKALPPRRRLYCSDECARVGRQQRRQLRRFFKEHAITPEVGFARPYDRYYAYDPSPVQRAFAGLPKPGQKGYMTRLARQDDGVVINRHRALPELSHVYAELRPDAPVRTGPPVWHYHPTVRTNGDVPVIPDGPSAGQELSKRRIYSLDAMQRNGHIARHKNSDDHAGVNNEAVHCHVPQGKYLFCPGRDYAKRLDVHPLALPLFDRVGRVFFVIEGCIKADAVLSQGEAVFSVPSVTLWDAPELPAFIDTYLQDKEVVIVPDADWYENGAVMTQAMLCRSFLRRHRIEALVAAPPIEGVKDGIKGVDDFLAAGGKLSDLVVIEREVEPLRLLKFLSGQRRTITWHDGREIPWGPLPGSSRRDGRNRNAEVVEALALHAVNGDYAAPLRTIARVMNVPIKKVTRAVDDLLEYGAITVDKPLRTQSGVWRGNYFDRAEEWVDRPTITVHPDLRATETSRPLGMYTQSDTLEGGSKVDAATANRILDGIARIEASNARIELHQRMQGERDDYDRAREDEADELLLDFATEQ